MFLLSIVQNLFSGNRGTPYTGLYGGMGGGAWVGGGGGGQLRPKECLCYDLQYMKEQRNLRFCL